MQIRNEVRGVGPNEDYRNLLYGLMYAQIPSVNSWESILMFCERPVAHSALVKIQQALGRDRFPVISQSSVIQRAAERARTRPPPPPLDAADARRPPSSFRGLSGGRALCWAVGMRW